MYDFQKADMWKRISAWLFDFILLGIVIVGAATALSAILRYDAHYESLEACYDKYEEAYGIDLGISNEDYEKLPDEVKQKYLDAGEKMQTDVEIRARYDIIVNLVLVITVFSIMLGFLIMEFIIPLCLGNGQTLGKKIFSIGVMRTDGVRVTNLQMFVRAVLGKCTLETLIPVFIVLMIILKVMGIVGIAILAALLLSEIVLLIATKERTPLHDIMSGTVTVDIASQMIFDSTEELLAYKQKAHAQKVGAQKEHAAGGEQ
jgi:uncharacterized RDD family membrane protein YckC